MNLQHKTAIVTGGAVGIGFGIAYRLAEAGARVVIHDINSVTANEAVRQLKKQGWQAMAVSGDVSKAKDVANLVKQTVTRFKSIDILVNNAGIYPNILLMNMKESDFEKVINVNLKGVFLCTQAVAKQMIKQKRSGKIINITSVDALHPSMPGLAHYDASKHGVWGFTKNSALELAQHQIWVNAVAPGGIMTPGVSGVQKKGSKPNPAMQAAIKQFMQKIPMHRFGEPDEIGKAVLFLASDMSSYMTGSQIVVDGGVLLS